MINRLLGLSCYLSGSIDFSPDKGVGWRDDITPFLVQKNIKVLNPLHHSRTFHGMGNIDTVKRPYMAKLLQEGNYAELQNEMRVLNHLDLRCIDLSSFMIVNYDTSIHVCGTVEEISICNKQQKPILLMCKNGKKKLPSWLYGRLPYEHFFETWGELKEYLTNIDSSSTYEFSKADKKRWLFWSGSQHEANNFSNQLVIIESPYAGDRATNTLYAQRCMKDSLLKGEAPFLSHLLYTQCLEDSVKEDRKMGLEAGWAWIKNSNKTVVYQDYGISSGMEGGIKIAQELNHPIEYRNIGKND